MPAFKFNFQLSNKKQEKLLTMFTSVCIKFTYMYLCIWQIYGVFSLHLIIPGIWSFWGHIIVNWQIDISFLCICPVIDHEFCHNIVNNRTVTIKTNINLFFMVTNCRISCWVLKFTSTWELNNCSLFNHLLFWCCKFELAFQSLDRSRSSVSRPVAAPLQIHPGPYFTLFRILPSFTTILSSPTWRGPFTNRFQSVFFTNLQECY